MDTKPVVLIVDDEPINIQALVSCLKDRYEIKVATNGASGIELAHSEPKPDLILLDIVMPGMDGRETLRKLQDDDSVSNIPVIFVTSSNTVEDESLGLQLGAVDYIGKPVRSSIVQARVRTHITLKQQRDQLAKLATRDQLTGLYNRHYFIDSANKKISRAARNQCPLSLMMIDIDHFKSINDQHGHQVGDSVLQAMAAVLLEQCREGDDVVRFGGEEFIILLDDSDIDGAGDKAEAIRQSIEHIQIMQISITCSIGVAQLNKSKEDIDSWVNRADKALYQAKETGRNKVVLAQSDS